MFRIDLVFLVLLVFWILVVFLIFGVLRILVVLIILVVLVLLRVLMIFEILVILGLLRRILVQGQFFILHHILRRLRRRTSTENIGELPNGHVADARLEVDREIW